MCHRNYLNYRRLNVSSFEPRHDKKSKMNVRPAKTQISQGMRQVWSESSLSAWRNIGSIATHWAQGKTLIRLGGCPGWSESSLGAHLFCWFCHETSYLMLKASFCILHKGSNDSVQYIFLLPLKTLTSQKRTRHVLLLIMRHCRNVSRFKKHFFFFFEIFWQVGNLSFCLTFWNTLYEFIRIYILKEFLWKQIID